MNGEELFQYYISKRNYSGSAEDEYAQRLMTISSNIFKEIYPLLEHAEVIGKKLVIKPLDHGYPLLNGELSKEDIGFE